MIRSDEQLEQALEVQVALEKALAALKARVHARNPQLYAAMAQDYLSQIRAIRADVDEYRRRPPWARGAPEARPVTAR